MNKLNKPIMVIATGNAGKVREFQNILGVDSYEYLTLEQIGFSQEIVENGKTFAENSLIKAKVVREFLDLRGVNWPILSDDSGLEVEALDGAPGVQTARYAGPGVSDDKNYRKLLSELQNQAEKGNANRNARFVCVLTHLDGTGHAEQFQGFCEGTILPAPVGNMGFGYDPVFQPQGQERSFAQMSLVAKKALSHRGQAIHLFKQWLATQS